MGRFFTPSEQSLLFHPERQLSPIALILGRVFLQHKLITPIRRSPTRNYDLPKENFLQVSEEKVKEKRHYHCFCCNACYRHYALLCSKQIHGLASRP